MPVRVHHVNCGTMCPLGPFGGRRLLNGEGSLFASGRMVCHCLLLETKSGVALVDTGLGIQDVRDPWRRLGRRFGLLARPRLVQEETAFAHVLRLGFRRSDVRHLLLTHLDPDHAGGLSDFPEADVHVYRAEHEAATSPRTYLERKRYRTTMWAHGPRWNLKDTSKGGDTWFGFESIRAIDGTGDDVLMIPLGGHTRGHCAIAVNTADGWLLHAGDAYFFHGEMDPERPRCTPGFAAFQRIVAHDDRARIENQARLRDLVRNPAHDVRVFCAHSPEELPSTPARAAESQSERQGQRVDAPVLCQ